MLGEYAVQNGQFDDAKYLLEKSLNHAHETSAASYLLGKVCDELKLYDQAFLYYQQAFSQSRNEYHASCALLELTAHLLNNLQAIYAVRPDDHDLRRQMFRLATLKTRAERLKNRYSKQPDEAAGQKSDNPPAAHICSKKSDENPV